MRRRPSGIIGAMPRSKSASCGSAWPSLAKTPHSATMSSRVVVSSSAMPSIVSPHSGKRRRFMPASTARRASSAVAAPVSRVSVSNAVSLRTRAAEPAQALGEHRGVGRDALGDALQPGGPVVDGVHAGDHRGQHLRRADVRGRALAPDVLLARLQREPIGRRAVRVDADADQAPGQAALVLVAAGEVGGVRAAAAHRHAEALGRAAGDVGAELARRRDQRQREQVGGDDEGGAVRVDARRVAAHVVQRAAGRRPLREHREVVAARDQAIPLLGRVGEDDLEAERRRARAQHLDRLRMGVAGDDDRVALGLDAAPRQRHRLGGGGRLVEHRRVRDRHAGEVADHRLEVDQRLEPALRDLGLVRRVRRVPGRVLEHVAQDDARRVRAVVALADEALQDPVLRRDAAQLGERLGLAERRRQAHRRRARDRCRHERVDQRAPRRGADHRQHVRLVVGVDADVAGDELAGASRARRAASGRTSAWCSGGGRTRSGFLDERVVRRLVHQRRRSRPRRSAGP